MFEFQDERIPDRWARYSSELRWKLMILRDLIFLVAREADGVGEIEETLRWGEAAYLTTQTGSGSMIRLDCWKRDPARVALYFHCQTNLVEGFREQFGDALTYDGNRALVFHANKDFPLEIVESCIAQALTYKRTRRSKRSR